VDLAAFQRLIRDTYGERDAARGLARTHAWFVEECGELSRALFREDRDRQREEFADVLAWLTTLADLAGVDLAEAARRYADGCPSCGEVPCSC
jgi:NTP pyrophosphatase (non-canonical NTP hydrolase)